MVPKDMDNGPCVWTEVTKTGRFCGDSVDILL